MSWERLLTEDVLVMLIPVVGILVGGAVAITSMIIKHRERMARIEHGLDPDGPRRE